jgi:hypothetical protein
METSLELVEKEIDLQIAKIDSIMDKRSNSGSQFDDYLREEKTRLYGMLHIYWLIGGAGYQKFKM